eukprot:359736-Chlamydomonas_euryale.AAC.3
MSVSEMCSTVTAPFRFLSIDGGHTKEVVFSDMRFAECHLEDGGIVAMDDVSHVYWLGVVEGISRYFAAHPRSRLAPFLMIANKMYITTRSHHAKFLKAMVDEPIWDDACVLPNGVGWCISAPGKNNGTWGSGDMTFADWGIAVAEHRQFDEAKLTKKWMEILHDA